MSNIIEHTEVLLLQQPQLDTHLEHITSEDLPRGVSACFKYCVVLDDHLELSSLLDPIIPTHVRELCTTIERRLTNMMSIENQNQTNANIKIPVTKVEQKQYLMIPSRSLYVLCKVRGIKLMSSYFPHNVTNLSFLIPSLIYISNSKVAPWELRFVLYLWASIAIRIPFPLESVLQPDVIKRCIEITLKVSLLEISRVSEVAVLFLSRLLARKDSSTYRDFIIDFIIDDYKKISSTSDTDNNDNEQNERKKISYLSLLASIFKYLNRIDLIPFIPNVFSILEMNGNEVPSSAVEAHQLSKLSHRIALVFLPPKLATWKYSKDTVTLLTKISKPKDQLQYAGHEGKVIEDQQEEEQKEMEIMNDEKISERLEIIIDLLFECLKHRDTVVRYSAAKGIARITSRLPKQYAIDIIDQLVQLKEEKNEYNIDTIFHGICLTIAELCRRGLLIPSLDHFTDCLQLIKQAARFELRKTSASIGTYVRDAACYAIWAIARAYNHHDITSFASIIVDAIIPVALLDREVNCRRAASAALQECIGRLHSDVFPDGIQLITIADYFSLSDRSNSFLLVTPKVAALGDGQYVSCIIQELWNSKLIHWDSAVRSLASKSLAKLVPFDKENDIVNGIIPKLIPMATQRGDAVNRHGAVLGLAELVCALSETSLKKYGSDIRQIPMILNDKGYFNGRTGNDMQIASCLLIKKLANNGSIVYTMEEKGREEAEKSTYLLERLLSSGKEKMYAEATEAYAAMFKHVISKDEDWHVRATRRVLNGLLGRDGHSTELQRGFSLAIGSCELSKISDEVVDSLCKSVINSKDVEVRKNSAVSLANVPWKCVDDKFHHVLRCLNQGMKDYTTDERGDIGSIIREVCMSSFHTNIARVFDNDSNNRNRNEDDELKDIIIEGIENIIFECCGRIDRTRTIAGRSLKKTCEIFSILHSEKIRCITKVTDDIINIFRFRFTNNGDKDNNESDETEVTFENGEYSFPSMRKALKIKELSTSVMRGFISSGGGTRTQFRAPSEALVEYFETDLKQTKEKETKLKQAIMSPICEKDPRLMSPALNVLTILIRKGTLNNINKSVLIQVVKDIRTSWKGRLKDVRTILAGIIAMEDLMALSIDHENGGGFVFHSGSIGKETLEALMVLLGCGIPRLRGAAAQAIYTALVMCDIDGYGNGCHEGVLKAMDCLLDVPWKVADVKQVRSKRDEICKLLGVKAPAVASATIKTTNMPQQH